MFAAANGWPIYPDNLKRDYDRLIALAGCRASASMVCGHLARGRKTLATFSTYLATPLERDADGPVKPPQDVFCALLGVDGARVHHSSWSLRLDPLAPRAEVWLRGYQVWDASGQGGPYYTVRTRYTAEGLRTVPQLVMPPRLPSERSMVSYHLVR